MNGKLAIMLLIFLAAFTIMNKLDRHEEWIQQEFDQLRSEIRQEQAELREQVRELQESQGGLLERMQDWLDEWEIQEAEISFYAPLDPLAVPGMCHDGNPNVTALGYRPGPGIYAVDFDVIPPHSLMWVQGEGWGIAGDTGGAIKGKRVDVYRDTYKQAMAEGRQSRVIVYGTF